MLLFIVATPPRSEIHCCGVSAPRLNFIQFSTATNPSPEKQTSNKKCDYNQRDSTTNEHHTSYIFHNLLLGVMQPDPFPFKAG